MSGLDFADDARTFAVTDFDGDGVPDLVLKNRLGPQIRAMQNDCAGGRSAIAISLRGTKSNRDAIGARVEVNGQAQYLSAGSGFLSQHSKKLHFGLAGQPLAHVKITWPSGAVEEASGLEPGYAYTIVEGSSERGRAQPFRARRALPASVRAREERSSVRRYLAARAGTHAGFADGQGRGRIHRATRGGRPKMPPGLPVRWIDLKIEKDDVAASYSLFRRYLFEYRADLSLPLVLLVDGGGRARKVYADSPRRTRCAAIWRALARAMRWRCHSPANII